MSEPMYGRNAPYQDGTSRSWSPNSFPPVNSNPWRYPLHDLLMRQSTRDATCIVLPELKFRNWGIKQFNSFESVVNVQTRREIVNFENLTMKSLIHTSFSNDLVKFDSMNSNPVGSTMCQVNFRSTRSSNKKQQQVEVESKGLIKTSQGQLLQQYEGRFDYSKTTISLPIEPLTIAHYVQRDLDDCLSKTSFSSRSDSTSLKEREIKCEIEYLPSNEEMNNVEWVQDLNHRFLIQIPDEGTIVDDVRVKESWPAKATRAILSKWQRTFDQTSQRWVDHDLIQQARTLVNIVNL
ncbi:hypothetical protein OIO90_001802 [Microbotryomycetes sp. JL221]|nr:hypothetical protein OIO90_001802 [Microbotryomycetes sp. JL221]